MIPKRVQLPGAALGVQSMKQVHEFNTQQIRRRGFFFRAAIGMNTFNIQLSGNANFLCGILIFDETGEPQNNLTLTINNDQRIEQVSCSSLCRIWERPAGLPEDHTFGINPYDEEFFPVPTLLSGQDAITLEYNCTVGTNLFVTFYYI